MLVAYSHGNTLLGQLLMGDIGYLREFDICFGCLTVSPFCFTPTFMHLPRGSVVVFVVVFCVVLLFCLGVACVLFFLFLVLQVHLGF